jgi:hypothetical protein
MLQTESNTSLIREDNANWLEIELLAENESHTVGGVYLDGDFQNIYVPNDYSELNFLGETVTGKGFRCHLGPVHRQITMVRINKAYVPAITICNLQTTARKLHNQPRYHN